jgi:hypothetical protein
MGKWRASNRRWAFISPRRGRTRIVAGAAVRNFLINIPPGDSDYVVTAQLKVPVDVDLVGVTPHAHLICKDMQGNATLPDGKKIPLIWIKDWDFQLAGTIHVQNADPPAGGDSG